MNKEMKYKNYKELKAAYDNGELDKELSPLMMDNDESFVMIEDETVFKGNGRYDILEIAEVAGFPIEEV